MPTVKVQIGNEVFEGPTEQLQELLRDNPGAKVIGSSGYGEAGDRAVRTAATAIGEFLRPPTQQGLIGQQINKFAATTPALPILGGFAGSAAGPAGTVAGAAGGEAYRQLLQRKMGMGEAPQTSLEAAKRIGREAAYAAGGEAVGAGLKFGLGSEVQRIAPKFLKNFAGAPEKSAEALAEDAGEVFRMAKMGEKGIQTEAAKLVSNARQALGNIQKAANKRFGDVRQSLLKATGGSPVIPAQNLGKEILEEATNFGFVEGLSSTDRVGMATIQRYVKGLDQLAKNGKLNTESAALLRRQINEGLRNPKLSDSAKGVLTIFKDKLDDAIKIGVGDDLAGDYIDVLEEASKVRELSKKVSPIINSKNAPIQIAKNLDTGTEIGQALDEFDEMAGGVLKPVKQASRAQFFGSEAPLDISGGNSFISLSRLPLGLPSYVPVVGRPFTPYGIAAAANVIRNPQNITRPLAQYYGDNVRSSIFERR